jgi:hypothetical protein
MTDDAWLLDRAGIYLQVHARLTDAKPLLERALAISETAQSAPLLAGGRQGGQKSAGTGLRSGDGLEHMTGRS